ncbi:MAG: peptidylprolyl isomerase [Pseudomonadota bacterium]
MRFSAPRALALAPLLALTLAPAPLTAQDQSADAPAQTAPADAALGEAAPVSIDDVVATVDGTEITLGTLILMRANLPDQYQNIPDEQLYEGLLQQAVNQVLLERMGLAAGADDAPLARLRADLDRRNYLAEAGLREIIEAATADDALRPLYEARYVNVEPQQEVQASHILVPELEQAEAIKAEIDGGRAFADAAQEHGTDGTAARGGDLGWFTAERMVAPFAEAAFAAEEGVLTGPIETQFGWHLILVTGKRDQPAPPFEQVREELARDSANAAAEAAIESARAEADILVPETPPAAAGIRRDDLLLP